MPKVLKNLAEYPSFQDPDLREVEESWPKALWAYFSTALLGLAIVIIIGGLFLLAAWTVIALLWVTFPWSLFVVPAVIIMTIVGWLMNKNGFSAPK